MKELIIKPGSVLLYKKYGWAKRTFAKLFKIKLNYNAFVFLKDITILLITSDINGEVMQIVEPVKGYNTKESTLAKNIADTSDSLDTKDLFIIINAVRPHTFSDNEENLKALLSNKYYKIIDLDNETSYNKYIY